MEAKMFRKIIPMIIKNVYVNKLSISIISKVKTFVNIWLFILTSEKKNKITIMIA